jgi:hypothetical protein
VLIRHLARVDWDVCFHPNRVSEQLNLRMKKIIIGISACALVLIAAEVVSGGFFQRFFAVVMPQAEATPLMPRSNGGSAN